MKYTRNDLENIIAICEQEKHADISVPAKLAARCKKALAYRDVTLRLTRQDKEFLQYMYDDDMDADAKNTLQKILL